MKKYELGISIVVPVGSASHLSNLFKKHLINAISYAVNNNNSLNIEIIIVNNSQDNIDLGAELERLSSETNIILKVIEANKIRSPYYARNMGADYSTYKVLAFLDASCNINKHWIVSAYNSVLCNDKCIYVGPYSIHIDPENKYWGSVYSLNFPNVYLEAEKGGAPGGNIVVSKCIYDKIGIFNNVRSGGDTQWFLRAKGCDIRVKCITSLSVRIFSKKATKILQQAIRLGNGLSNIHKSQGKTNLWILLSVLWNLRPYNICRFIKTIKNNNYSIYDNFIIYFLNYIYILFNAFGRLGLKKVFSIESD